MENHEYSVGLDIGTTKIVAIVGRRNDRGKIEVLGVGKAKSLGVHKGIVNNIAQTISSIKAAVEQAESSAGVSIRKVTVLHSQSPLYPEWISYLPRKQTFFLF